MKKLLSSPKNVAILLTIFLLLILLASVGSLFLPRLFPHSNLQGYVAEVYQDGSLILSLPLTDGSQDLTYEVNGADGAFNVIHVRGQSIAVTEASCPDKLCVHQGYCSDSLLPIVCLPNHLVIRLRPANDSDESDALTY